MDLKELSNTGDIPFTTYLGRKIGSMFLIFSSGGLGHLPKKPKSIKTD
jgi:hypothetical protein